MSLSKESRGREVLRGKLFFRKKGNNSWKRRGVAAHCGLEEDSKKCAMILIYEDYEKPGQKPKNSIKLEEAKIDSSYSNSNNGAYNSTIASPSGGMRVSVSPGYSSGGSGSGTIGSDTGIVLGGSHVFTIMPKSGDCYEFKTETENERLRWVKLLQLLIMYPRATIPDEPKTNPIKASLKQTLEAKQFGANSAWPVYILPEDVGGRSNIIGINVLALRSGIPGKQVGTLSLYGGMDYSSPVMTWDRDKMRRTGKTGNLVFIEIGRRCQGGPGLVWMYAGFSDAQPLRETLHNFLFKGDGNAVPIHTQTPTIYDSPRASFDSHIPLSRENSIGSLPNHNPILSRSRSQDHDSGFVGSPNSFTSPRLEGPPVRLDKHPSIRRKRDSTRSLERRSSSTSGTTPPRRSFSDMSVRSEPSESNGHSSSRSLSPEECDGDVVGDMDPESEHSTPNVAMYDVVTNGTTSLKRVVVGRPSDYEDMSNPRSSLFDPEYVMMSKAQPATKPISVPKPQAYNTLQHFPNKTSPQSSSSGRNSYDTLPTIREKEIMKHNSASPSDYINHPLPYDVKNAPSRVYTPEYENVSVLATGRRGSADDYENSAAAKKNSLKRNELRNGAENYVMFQPRNIPISEYTRLHPQVGTSES